MAENAIVKILTVLLKHQVKKVVGDETLGVIGQEISALGGDKVDDQIKSWLGKKTNVEELEKAAQSAQTCFREKVADNEFQQWMVSLPLGNLPKVVEALEELPRSPDESKLESALRESIALNWTRLSPEQVNNAVNAFISCLRSALLPISTQTLMVIGRSVLRTEDKVDLLLRWFEQYIITGKPTEIKQLNPEPVETWNLKHPYAMPPNFTGRVEERKMLVDWLNNDNENRLFILRALGGFGKSALSWHWLTHDVDSKQWTKVLWWSFYEGDASFEHFIEETLKYLKLEVPQGQRPQVDELLKAMQGQKILLIMDGFERALRAYSSMNAAYQGDEFLTSPSPRPPSSPVGEEGGAAPRAAGVGEVAADCVNINAEIFLKSVCSLPNIKSKVVMTTRLTPRAVKPRGEFMLGCREEELTAMQPADAVEFFHKQKIKGTHAEIEAACAPYGYHPLSLRLLAGRMLKDFENPADIVVAQKLKIDGDIIQQKHHVLEVSYNSLPLHEQKLLSTIACFRSPVELKTLETIEEDNKSLQDDLHDLVARGLLHFDAKNRRFDLHPIVRQYSYHPFLEKGVTHKKLAEYFRKQINAGNILLYSDAGKVLLTDKETNIKTLDDLEPVIELYHHLVKSGRLDEAQILFYERLNLPLYYRLGSHQLRIELLKALFIDGENSPPRLNNVSAQGWAMSGLANSYGQNGQPRQASNIMRAAILVSEKIGEKLNIAIGLQNLAQQQLLLGALSAAHSDLIRSMNLCSEIQDFYWQVAARQYMGELLFYEGIWNSAETFLNFAVHFFDKFGVRRTNSVSVARALLAKVKINRKETEDAITLANEALALSKHPERSQAAGERDIISAFWLLGTAYRLNHQLEFAEQHLTEALMRNRAINLVDIEASILLDLARLRYDQKKTEEAKSLADEALLITERCGYVLQGADVNLFLAQYALEQEQDKAKAKEYAEEALKLATCDGPPYYYKVAYEEAERMLKMLNAEG